jgi:segregation and condensation protein A
MTGASLRKKLSVFPKPDPCGILCPVRLDYAAGTSKIKPTLTRETVDYRVELDVYNGPLDLLLYLIKKDELDIYDIPIARITDTYMSYLHMLKELRTDQGLDINVAGEFLVMAATLMEIKSAMLLPRAPVAETPGEASAAQQLTDPRYELVQQLLEYKRFKDAAMSLEHHQQQHQDRFPRYPAKAEGEGDEPPPVDLDEVQVWDLLDAFSRLMKEVGGRRPRYHEVTYDDTPIDLHAADIEDRLKREPKLTLRQLVEGRKSRSEMIGVFLALLELIREKKILVQQNEELGDVEIIQAPEEHRRTYAQASLHLAVESAPEPAPLELKSEPEAQID